MVQYNLDTSVLEEKILSRLLFYFKIVAVLFLFFFSEIEISLYYLLSVFYLQFISISATIQNMQIYRVSVLFEYEISWKSVTKNELIEDGRNLNMVFVKIEPRS